MRIPFLTILSLGAFALTGCFNESTMAPDPIEPATKTDDVWQAAIDELATMEGGEELLAEMAPLLEKARASRTGSMLRDGGETRFFLAFETTTIEVVPPFPPPILTLEISYQGVGTMLGSYTAFSLSSVDVTVVPNVQFGNQTATAANGDELVTAYEGIAVPGEGPGDVEFEGSSSVIGGTGRFAGATGTIYYTGQANQIEATGRVLRWGYIALADDDD